MSQQVKAAGRVALTPYILAGIGGLIAASLTRSLGFGILAAIVLSITQVGALHQAQAVIAMRSIRDRYVEDQVRLRAWARYVVPVAMGLIIAGYFIQAQ